ncbi:MAG: hypothetical protein EOO77_17820, partial [Oxalobacteraceae bacterium]
QRAVMHAERQVHRVRLPQILEDQFGQRAGIAEDDRGLVRLDLGDHLFGGIASRMARPRDTALGEQNCDIGRGTGIPLHQLDGIDIAIRVGVGSLDDSSFGARRLALVERLVVAAPSYLRLHGSPAEPAELARHACIIQHGLFGRESWRFTHDQTVTAVDVSAKLSINSAPGVLAAAVAGIGIALATRIMAGDELLNGQLTQLLEAWQLAPAEVHAIFPAGPKLSAKVRAIVDHLGEALSKP